MTFTTLRNIELYLKSVIKGKKQGLLPFFIKGFLLPISWVYSWIVYVRNWLYDKGWMRRYVPPIPIVMSVGNIVAGGTGKTPVTLLLAREFYDRFTLAILSRGYRSKSEKLKQPIILCDGHGPLYPASYCGDEPYMYANRYPKAYVIVGGNRKKACYLASKAGAQIVLLDDAMQHRRLARDLDVVVVDAKNPFGYGYFLPRGFLREHVKSLSRAHLIILNHFTCQDQFHTLKKQLRKYTDTDIVGSQITISSFFDLKGNSVEINNEKVGMFCAIAHPDYFKETLEKEGCSVVTEHCLCDHDEIDEKVLENFALLSAQKGAKWLICTEKDKVKLKENLSLSLPIAWVQLELKIVQGQEIWKSFIDKVLAQIIASE